MSPTTIAQREAGGDPPRDLAAAPQAIEIGDRRAAIAAASPNCAAATSW